MANVLAIAAALHGKEWHRDADMLMAARMPAQQRWMQCIFGMCTSFAAATAAAKPSVVQLVPHPDMT